MKSETKDELLEIVTSEPKDEQSSGDNSNSLQKYNENIDKDINQIKSDMKTEYNDKTIITHKEKIEIHTESRIMKDSVKIEQSQSGHQVTVDHKTCDVDEELLKCDDKTQAESTTTSDDSDKKLMFMAGVFDIWISPEVRKIFAIICNYSVAVIVLNMFYILQKYYCLIPAFINLLISPLSVETIGDYSVCRCPSVEGQISRSLSVTKNRTF